MKMEWTDDLATNIPFIDIQHKNIFIETNKFLESVSQGRSQAEFGRAIKVLQDCVHNHFSTEEKYMLQNNYPHYKQHNEQHKKYITIADNLEMEFELKNLAPDFEKKIEMVLTYYWTDHIQKFDIPLAHFLNKGGQK